MITITFNGNPNVPLTDAHRSHHNLVQMTAEFDDFNSAYLFWNELEFYGNSITTFEEVMQHYPIELVEMDNEYKEIELLYNAGSY
jgi:hypothetical protein